MTHASSPIGILKLAQDERGVRYRVEAGLESVEVVVSFHALARARRWHTGLENVLRALVAPEEVLRGHRGRFVAHRRDARGLLRVVYAYERAAPFVVTIHHPSATLEFEGRSTHEDHVLSRR